MRQKTVKKLSLFASLINIKQHFTMTINDHDQFTGLNAVHVAASEGNVKRLVELMDDGAELDVPALGGTLFLVCF